MRIRVFVLIGFLMLPWAAPAQNFGNGDSYGPTGPGDTLWKIAERLRSDNTYTVKEMMLALFLNNRQAFSSDNINRLKANHILQKPSQSQLEEVAAMNVESEIARYSNGGGGGSQSGVGNLRKAEAKERRIDAKNEQLRKRINELEKELQSLQVRREELNQKLDR